MIEERKLEFEKSLQLRNFEIETFWKRGWFFGALILALISGYISNKGGNDKYFPSSLYVVFSFHYFIDSNLNEQGKQILAGKMGI